MGVRKDKTEMVGCKNFKSEQVVKNGIVRGKQRYKCKECGYNFVESDGRTNDKDSCKKGYLCCCILLVKPHSMD
jgi:transposase-like protein